MYRRLSSLRPFVGFGTAVYAVRRAAKNLSNAGYFSSNAQHQSSIAKATVRFAVCFDFESLTVMRNS